MRSKVYVRIRLHFPASNPVIARRASKIRTCSRSAFITEFFQRLLSGGDRREVHIIVRDQSTMPVARILSSPPSAFGTLSRKVGLARTRSRAPCPPAWRETRWIRPSGFALYSPSEVHGTAVSGSRLRRSRTVSIRPGMSMSSVMASGRTSRAAFGLLAISSTTTCSHCRGPCRAGLGEV